MAQKRKSAFKPKSAGPKSPVCFVFLAFSSVLVPNLLCVQSKKPSAKKKRSKYESSDSEEFEVEDSDEEADEEESESGEDQDSDDDVPIANLKKK